VTEKRLLLVFVLAVCLQPVIAIKASAQAPASCDSCDLMAEALSTVQSFAPGTPRSKVEQEFSPDGGLQFFYGPSRYIFRKCPLIKVDIEFTHFDGEQDGLPSDQVVKVSRPYLEYPFSD
jgi:hypothetical protein